ncbi:hypothetical protein ACERIM_13430 [Natrinema sp. H-ect1]|uniref:hypothetical protein n=1 Tax=Natrinema sp. H-ect1 TaxID=3242700 RepID=UPI00359DDB09
MSHEEWAAEVQRDVWEYWDQEHDDWPYGVKTFYSPVHAETDLLILGFQPGGDGKSSEHDGDFSTPDTHHYVNSDWDLAEEMQKLFSEHEEVLNNSVASNVIFFRSPDIDKWDALPSDRRLAIEKFCWNHIEELIYRVDPNVILTVGIRTFDKVIDRLDLESKVLEKRGRERLVVSSAESSPQIVGTMHLTGAQIASEDRTRLYKRTRELLQENVDNLSFEGRTTGI